MKHFSLRLLLCILALSAIAACQLQRAPIGSPQNQAQWDVQPPFFCPGDPVTVSWDMSHLPRNITNCNPPSVSACTSSSTCPGGASSNACLDGFCCSRSVFDVSRQQCPTSTGCYPAFSFGITSSTGGNIVTGETHAVTGNRTVTPTETTTFTINGVYNPPPIVYEDNKTTTMVRPLPGTAVNLQFPFTCNGSPGWASQDFNMHPLATEHALVASVRNNTRHRIILTTNDLLRAPIDLMPGESTTELNGNVVGIWSVRLHPTDPARITIPRCEPTNIRDPWPDLTLELTLQCSAM